MATLTEEESDQMSRLLNKLGLLAGKVYTLEDLRALIMSPPGDKKWVKVREDENYVIYESASHVKEMKKLMKWTMKWTIAWIQLRCHAKDVLATEEEERTQKEEEWITVNHRVKGRRNRGARAGGGVEGRNQGRGFDLWNKVRFRDGRKK